MSRDLGGTPLGTIQANEIDWSYFVRIDIASPVGTKRWTDRPAGDFTGNVDGSSQTWTGADLIMGPLDQGDQEMVSWMDFANLDYTWTSWANSPGLRGATVQVWVAWFDAAGAVAGSYKVYDGRVDNGEYGPRAKMALTPQGRGWSRDVPYATIQELGFNLMPAQGITIYWGTQVPGNR